VAVRNNGQTDVYECPPCGSLDDLLRVARQRVRRELTPYESQRYLQ